MPPIDIVDTAFPGTMMVWFISKDWPITEAVPFNCKSLIAAIASLPPAAATTFSISAAGVKEASAFASTGAATSLPSKSKYFTGPYFSKPFAICFALPTITICICAGFNKDFATA